MIKLAKPRKTDWLSPSHGKTKRKDGFRNMKERIRDITPARLISSPSSERNEWKKKVPMIRCLKKPSSRQSISRGISCTRMAPTEASMVRVTPFTFIHTDLNCLLPFRTKPDKLPICFFRESPKGRDIATMTTE